VINILISVSTYLHVFRNVKIDLSHCRPINNSDIEELIRLNQTLTSIRSHLFSSIARDHSENLLEIKQNGVVILFIHLRIVSIFILTYHIL